MKTAHASAVALCAIVWGAGLPAHAQSAVSLKPAIDDKWACIGANTAEGNPAKAKFAKTKGCVSDFAAACEDIDLNEAKALTACYRREEAVWDGVIRDHLLGDAKAGEAQKPGVTHAMAAAASAMRASRDRTCAFVGRYEVNGTPPRQFYCRLNRTAEFAMVVYLALYTP